MIVLRDEFFVKDDAYLYWIKTKDMTDISSQGYVGVTRKLSERLNQHNYSLSKEVRSRYYHNGFVKAFNKGGLEMVVVHCGAEDLMYSCEQVLRPKKNIGWNYAVGGDAHGTSNRNFKIAGIGFSFSRASEIFGRSHHQVHKSISAYNKSPEEALGTLTTTDNGSWCNYPTRTGYIKFLFPISDIDRLKVSILEDFKECKNLTKIGNKYGISGRTARKIITEIHEIALADSRNCCYNDVWFTLYTELSSETLFNILDYYFKVMSAKTVGIVYSINAHQVMKIVNTYQKVGGENPYNVIVEKDNVPFRLIFELIQSGQSFKEVADRFEIDSESVRFRYYASVSMFYEEYMSGDFKKSLIQGEENIDFFSDGELYSRYDLADILSISKVNTLSSQLNKGWSYGKVFMNAWKSDKLRYNAKGVGS